MEFSSGFIGWGRKRNCVEQRSCSTQYKKLPFPQKNGYNPLSIQRGGKIEGWCE
jgi:hypothetical protein